MSKTNDLRKLIQSKLKTVCNNVYYEYADDDNMYPHITFSINTINNDNLNRNDLTVDIDIFDKGKQATNIENMTDSIEALFNNQNLPQTGILPTFYLIDRRSIPDEDKKIRHRLIRVLVQNYERKV